MRAMIMAAGLGTRLRPLTDSLPKPLVPVAGQPMIAYVLQLLEKHGYSEALLNVHYLPEKMEAFAAEWNEQGRLPRLFTQDERKEILGSGGGLVKARSWLFDGQHTALVCNADVIADPELSEMREAHKKLVANFLVECTLAVMEHPEAGKKYTGLSVENDLVTGFVEKGTGKKGLLHFPGFYFIEESAVSRLGRKEECFSVLERSWRPLAQEKKLGAWKYEGSYWDLGTVDDLHAAEIYLSRR